MVPTESIEPTPEVAANADHEYLRGIAKLGERLIILLSLDGLFGTAEAAAIADVAA
jgi:purine-binding chemotaxis protein CheW